MKTFALDAEAYSRLEAWKNNPAESFSSVVKRVLPNHGTLGAYLSFVERRGTANLNLNQILEDSVEIRSVAKDGFFAV